MGHRNQIYFTRFLFFAVVGCLHASVFLGIVLYNTMHTVGHQNTITFPSCNPQLFYGNMHSRRALERTSIIRDTTSFVLVILSISVAMGVVLAVGALLYTQVMIIVRNKTGIEEYICKCFLHRVQDEKARFKRWNMASLEIWNFNTTTLPD